MCPVRAMGVSRTRRTHIIDAGNFSRLYSIGFGVSSHSRNPKSEILATQLTNILGRFRPKVTYQKIRPPPHTLIHSEIPANTQPLLPGTEAPPRPSQQADSTPDTAHKSGGAPSGARPSIGNVRFSPLTY